MRTLEDRPDSVDSFLPGVSPCRRHRSLAVAGCLGIALLLAAPVWSGAEVKVVDGIPHVTNTGPSAEGSQVLRLEELWRRGGEDDEVFFGYVAQVVADADGNVYVLDQQQSHVEVFSPDGEHLRTLGREGEGPGEVYRPIDMVMLPDGTLGLVQYLGVGRIVQINLDGTPAGAIMPPGSEDDGAGFASLARVRCQGENLVVNGAYSVPKDNDLERTQFITRWTSDGRQTPCYWEKTSVARFETEGWIEKDQYFPDQERWTLGPAGRVYVAGQRNEYAISVFSPDGALELVIEGPYRPHRRTEEEKQALAAALIAVRDGGERVQLKSEIEDASPALAEVSAREDGSLWVLPTSGLFDQPDGVMQTYDVFDHDGLLVRRLQIACEGDPRQDRLVFFAAGRVALIRGAREAQQAAFGGARSQQDGDQGAPVHEVVIYRYETN